MLDEVRQVARLFAEGTLPASPTDSTVTVAVISTAGLVLAALIAGYFGTRGERAGKIDKEGATQLRTQIAEAELDAAHAENERRDAERREREASARVAVLSRALYRRGYDPSAFVDGLEGDDVARITTP